MTRQKSLTTGGRKTPGCSLTRCLTRHALLITLTLAVTPAWAWQLDVVTPDEQLLTRLDLPESGRWCLLWNHSVQGFQVEDCFLVENGILLLDSTQTPDFAAGLGHIPGRGDLGSDNNHGYRITNFNQPLPGNQLVLRVGSMQVNHRIAIERQLISLSELAFDQRVIIRLTTEEPIGSVTP